MTRRELLIISFFGLMMALMVFASTQPPGSYEQGYADCKAERRCNEE